MVPRGSARARIRPPAIKPPAWAKDQCRAKADTGGGDREQQMAWRVSQNAGAPGERAEKKQPDRARKDIDVQGSEKGNLAEPERQHVEEAARRIDAMRLRDILRQRGRAGPQSRRRKDLHRKVQPERRQRGDSQQPARTEQERQDDQSGERIFGENVAVPDQAKVDEPERQQHDEPAHEQQRAALALGQPLELDGKACAEQQRKQRKRLQIDGQHQDGFDGAVDRR